MKFIICYMVLFATIANSYAQQLIITHSTDSDMAMTPGEECRVNAFIQNNSSENITIAYEEQNVYAFLDEARICYDKKNESCLIVGGDDSDFMHLPSYAFDVDTRTGKIVGSHEVPPIFKTVTLKPSEKYPLIYRYKVPDAYPLGKTHLWLTLKIANIKQASKIDERDIRITETIDVTIVDDAKIFKGEKAQSEKP